MVVAVVMPAVDDGPWSECAGCGATIRPNPDAWDEWGIYHDQYCAECEATMVAADDETDERAGR